MSQDQSDIEQQDLWNLLVYRLLIQLEEEQPDWRSVTSTQFSKLPCIVDRYLIDYLDRNIEFPRYWYKYGEVGNREPLDSSLYIIDEAEDYGGLEVRPANTETNFNVQSEIKEEIDEAVNFVVDNCASMKAAELKSFQYEHFAPEDFIREFEEFRSTVYEHSPASVDESAATDAALKSQLKDNIMSLRDSYPDDRYEQMHGDFETWASIMEELIDRGELGSVEAQLEEFWKVFSKVHLRMEHNNHPISDQMERWEKENESVLRSYRDQLRNLEDRYLE